MPSKTIFRIENPSTMHGMWYNHKGEYDPAIHRLCPNALAGEFAMPRCASHSAHGKQWYSAGKSIANMQQWFNRQDALNLVAAGYVLYQFEVTEWQEKEMEVLFTREGILSQVEIPVDHVWPEVVAV